MRVVDFTYIPAVFEVKQGIPVEWRIDASEAVGCGLIILAPRLGIRQLLSSNSTIGDHLHAAADRRIPVQLRHGDDVTVGIEIHRGAGELGAGDENSDIQHRRHALRVLLGAQRAHLAETGRACRTPTSISAPHSARVEFDESVISESALHEAVIDNGYQVLSRDIRQEHKAQRATGIEAMPAQRAYLALAFDGSGRGAGDARDRNCRGSWMAAISASGFRPC